MVGCREAPCRDPSALRGCRRWRSGLRIHTDCRLPSNRMSDRAAGRRPGSAGAHAAAERLHSVAHPVPQPRNGHRVSSAARQRTAPRKTAGCRRSSSGRSCGRVLLSFAGRGRRHAAGIRFRRHQAEQSGNIETVVVFPAPFGPSTPRIWPGSMVRETSFTATRLPNLLRRHRISSMPSLRRAPSGAGPPRARACRRRPARLPPRQGQR